MGLISRVSSRTYRFDFLQIKHTKMLRNVSKVVLRGTMATRANTPYMGPLKDFPEDHNFKGKWANEKNTTGYTGLVVDPEASRMLPMFQKRILQILEDKYPEDSFYRTYMTSYYKEQMKMLEDSNSIRDFEDQTGQTIEHTMWDVKDEIKMALEL